jgi:hypothetical protein
MKPRKVTNQKLPSFYYDRNELIAVVKTRSVKYAMRR